MANIADNKFYLFSEETISDQLIQDIRKLVIEQFEGDIWFSDDNCIEGVFESRWDFPFDAWDRVIGKLPIYFRCLTEEYGMSLVSMNIHNEDGTWREPQYFDL